MSNLWIDRTRRLREPPDEAPETSAFSEPRATREAAGTLISRLSPQERAAVVLKEAFDLSLEEIAETLSTTVGAVKAALHRGRGKLVAPEAAEPRAGAGGARRVLRRLQRPRPRRAEVRSHRGESIVLFWYPQDEGEAVRDVARVETEGDRVSRWRNSSSRRTSSRRSAASSACRSARTGTGTGRLTGDAMTGSSSTRSSWATRTRCSRTSATNSL